MYQVQSGESDEPPWNPSHIGDSLLTQNDGNVGASSSTEGTAHITRLASIDSFDSKWYWLKTFCFMDRICFDVIAFKICWTITFLSFFPIA